MSTIILLIIILFASFGQLIESELRLNKEEENNLNNQNTKQ